MAQKKKHQQAEKDLNFALYQVKPLLPSLKPVETAEAYTSMLAADKQVSAMCYFAALPAIERLAASDFNPAGCQLVSRDWNVLLGDVVITITATSLTARRLGQLDSRGIDAYEALAELREAEVVK